MKQEMKKTLLSTLVLAGVLASAQVGINTEEPKATLDIKAGNEKSSGVLFPRVSTSKRNSFENPERGLLIYNTDKGCFEVNSGTPVAPLWECLATLDKVQTLSIEPLGFEGNFKKGYNVRPETHKVKFRVTNNTKQKLENLDLSFVKIEGGGFLYIDNPENQNNENVVLEPNESKELTYGIAGSPSGNQFTFTLAYDKFSQASITLLNDRTGTEEDPEGKATGNGGDANIKDKVDELFLVKDGNIDYSKTITANKPLEVLIPFTNGSGNYLAYESDEIIIEDAEGSQRKVKLKYEEGNLDIGTGRIKAKIITVDGADLKLPQIKLGEEPKVVLNIPIKLNDKEKATYKLIAFGGIKDKKYDEQNGKHTFIYMPVVTQTGRTWLNNNLGAEYNRVGSSIFDPNQQAKSLTDINAIGSFFQNRRDSDGHELSTIEDGVLKKNKRKTAVLAQNFQPNHEELIINSKSDIIPIQNREYNWVEKAYKNSHRAEWDNLWSLNGDNNPCPANFRLPTWQEIQNEIDYAPQFSNKGMFLSDLKLVSETEKTSDFIWVFDYTIVLKGTTSTIVRGGFAENVAVPVRCIKEEGK